MERRIRLDEVTGMNTSMIRVDRSLHDEIGSMRQLDESYADVLRKLVRGGK